MSRYSFSFAHTLVHVTWGSTAVEVPSACEAFDYRADSLGGGRLRLGSAPIFIVCPQQE